MYKIITVLLLATLLTNCSQNSESIPETTPKTETKITETEMMVNELRSLVTSGNPEVYYHWNKKNAALLLNQISQAPPQQQGQIWFKYCYELLYSGDSKTCIAEIENRVQINSAPLADLITEQTYPLFDLLALAYLRMGEQENCQDNHTPFSCVVPIQEPAFHALTQGSTRAIEIYSVLQSKFPNNQNKWLLNLAYMTLGKHPDLVSGNNLIEFPNWDLERKDFPRFEDIAMNVGVAQNGLSGGVSIEDFNNDGHLDIFATSYGMQDQVKLFLADGQGGYHDHTEMAGLQGIVSGLNCNHADYNNDGFTDILILRGAWLGQGGNHPNSLLKNNGDGTFTDVTRSSKLLSYHPTQTAAWADFNSDGFLDLFIGNEGRANQIHNSELYKNNGDGTFTNVAAEVGLANINQFIKGVAWGDINNDKQPDLFISVMGGQNLLFRNNNGYFQNFSGNAGIQEPISSFPCWFWDVNNDGLQDIFVSGYDSENLRKVAEDYSTELQGQKVTTAKPRLYINQGNETFKDASVAYGINRTMYSMGANYGDLDNDGFLDFYVGTGAPDFSSVVPNRMFLSKTGKSFEEVTSAGGFGHIQKGHGISFADLDRDGDQDIYAVMGGAYEGDVFTNVLYENPIDENNWIVIELEGITTNKSAIGTRIELELSSGRKINSVTGTGGSFGASSLQHEIGLGTSDNIKKLSIFWQNSETAEFTDIAALQKIKVTEGQTDFEVIEYNAVPFVMDANMEHNHH